MTLTPIEQKTFDSLLKLGVTKEEALEAITDDRRIDKGEKLFELSPELAEGAKKARRADRKPNSTPTKRERKEDEDKRFLIQLLKSTLENSDDEGFAKPLQIAITNPERQIDFSFSNRKFRIVLSAPRT